jgi:hypothetical protein
MYKLKLIRGRSYSGHGVKATAKEPLVDVAKKNIADYLVECGRFELVVEEKVSTSGQATTIPEGKPTDKWTVAQLQAYADERGIDLTGAANKAAMVAVIQEADKLTGETGIIPNFNEDE